MWRRCYVTPEGADLVKTTSTRARSTAQTPVTRAQQEDTALWCWAILLAKDPTATRAATVRPKDSPPCVRIVASLATSRRIAGMARAIAVAETVVLAPPAVAEAARTIRGADIFWAPHMKRAHYHPRLPRQKTECALRTNG